VYTAIVNIIVPLEISMGIARFFPDAESKHEKISYASTSLWFTVIIYLLFFCVSFIFLEQLSHFVLDRHDLERVFLAAVFSICGNGIFFLAQNQLRWQLQSKLYSIASLACTAISIVVSIILVLFLNMGVIGVILGQLSGNTLGASLALWFTRGTYSFTFDWRKLRELLLYSLPLVPSSISVFVALYIDRVVIKEFMSMGAVGLYGIGYRLASMSILVIVGFQGALTPLVYTYHKEAETPIQLAKIFRYFLALALFVFLFVSVFSRNIMTLLTTPDYYGAGKLIRILVPAVFLANMYIFAPGLYLAKKTKMIAVINICAAVMNTVLNLALVPAIGVLGAAISTLLSSILSFVLYLRLGQKEYPIPYGWTVLLKGALVTFTSFHQYVSLCSEGSRSDKNYDRFA
jgi:O-antigen/teichoic acid export membrane protein